MPGEARMRSTAAQGKVEEAHVMLPNASVWKSKLEDLRNQRRPLIGDFENRPSDVVLALKIKAIDDEIAVCTEHMRRENGLG
jgi:hypothetical protein